MFTQLALAAMLFSPSAPIPKAKEITSAGAAPKVLDLKPDSSGKITLVVTRYKMQKVTQMVREAGNPKPVSKVIERKVPYQAQVELNELEDLTIYNAKGEKLDTKATLKKLKDGGIVVASSDGKKVDPGFLKIFKEDTLVLVSPELPKLNDMTIRPVPTPAQNIIIRGGAIQLQQVIPPGAQIQKGGVQIQILPEMPLVPAKPIPAKPIPAKPIPVKPPVPV